MTLLDDKTFFNIFKFITIFFLIFTVNPHETVRLSDDLKLKELKVAQQWRFFLKITLKHQKSVLIRVQTSQLLLVLATAIILFFWINVCFISFIPVNRETCYIKHYVNYLQFKTTIYQPAFHQLIIPIMTNPSYSITSYLHHHLLYSLIP